MTDYDDIMRLASGGKANGAKVALPFVTEAEGALLGILLDRNSVFDKVSSTLKPEHFGSEANGRLFQAIGRSLSQGRVADRVTLKSSFKDFDVSELPKGVPTEGAAESYAATIADSARRRRLIEASLKAAENAADADFDGGTEAAIAELEEQIIALRDSNNATKGPRSLGDAGADAVAAAERAFKRRGKTTGVPTGFTELDRLTGGLQPGDLVYLAGRPSMGKSSLARCISINGGRAGHPSLIASLEMSDEQIGGAAVAAGARISVHSMRTGDLAENDFARLLEANEDLRTLPVEIIDDGSMTVAKLRSIVRRFLLKVTRLPNVGTDDAGQPLCPLVTVDYAQLFAAERRRGSRNDDMEEISRGLKAIAKDFKVAVLACCQLSRAVELRDNKRPLLSDLRDSGSLEQDADVVMFVFREEYYLARSEPTRQEGEATEKYNDRVLSWQRNCAAVRSLAEVIIAKQRLGPLGKAMLRFDSETTKFENLTTSTPSGVRYSAMDAST